jgi:hypothetical protein
VNDKPRENRYTGRPPKTRRLPNARERRLKAERLERSKLNDAIYESWNAYLIGRLKLLALHASGDVKAAYDIVIADIEKSL